MSSTLKKMGIVLKRPRPIHYNSSAEAREEFKKTAGEGLKAET